MREKLSTRVWYELEFIEESGGYTIEEAGGDESMYECFSCRERDDQRPVMFFR